MLGNKFNVSQINPHFTEETGKLAVIEWEVYCVAETQRITESEKPKAVSSS